MTQSTTDQDFWRGVPSVEDEPEPGVRRWAGFTGPDRPRILMTRRVTLQAMAALGGALALNVLSWLPPMRAPAAHAAVGTEYLHCANFDSWSGYNNNTAVCVGAPYHSAYCGADGWFMQGSGTCWVSTAVAACGTGGLSLRNAWRWTHAGTPYRCADGRIYTCDGSSSFRICSKANP
jgi:hypothetical protein